MKNLSLVLNFILVIAVGILYYLHFKAPAAATAVSPASVKPSKAYPVKPSSIVFLNSDSLLDNYAYLKVKKEGLEARHKKITAELQAEGERLQSDAESYRQHGAMMTDEQRAKTEEQLVMRQQQLVQKEKTLMSKLDDEQAAINEQLFKNLTGFLKEYNKDKNYQFILGYQKGGGILLANDSLDITESVIEGMNKKYSDESKGK
jgi:outer membrane protein